MTEIRIASPVKEIIDAQLMFFCDQKIAETKEMLDDLATFHEEWIHGRDDNQKDHGKSVHSMMRATLKYQSNKIGAFQNYISGREQPYIPFDHDKFRDQLIEFVAQSPRHKASEQSRERFHSIPEDKWWLKSIKLIKYLIFRVSRFPAISLNIFRKLFRKEVKQIPFWRYKIPLRALLDHQLENKMVVAMETVLSAFSHSLVGVMKSALDKEQNSNKRWIDKCLDQSSEFLTESDLILDLTEEYEQLAKIKAELVKKTDALLQQVEAKINHQKSITGTIEYPTVLLNYHNRKSTRENAYKSLVRTNIGWGNTAFALLEDWKIDQEIFNLAVMMRQEVTLLKEIFEGNNKNITGQLQTGQQIIEELKGRFLEQLEKPKPQKVSVIIKAELKALEQGNIKKVLYPAVEQIIQQNFARNIQKFENKISKIISDISQKRWLTKLTDYDTPLKRSDLDSFSPNELISFKQLPELQSSCSKLKSQNIRKAETLKLDVYNIENVVAFNLNTILESIESGTSDIKEAKKLIQEGVERSQNKLNEIIESLNTYERELKNELENILKQFNDSIMQLTNNENAFNLRITVTKAKALRRTEEVKNLFKDKAQHLYSKSKDLAILRFEKVNKVMAPWMRRIGFQGSKAYIATELSDFLSEAHTKINSLPIVYQQLYKIQPLTEMSLFSGRTMELEQLLFAYNSWKDGKYAPTAILGEKWSGHTTLINYFLNNHINAKNVIYENRLINIYTPSDFIEAWQKILKNDKIESLDDIINELTQKHKNKIIVIENLQNYYLRTIKGFESLNLMVELISKTYRHVFWLCSANIYAWDYLNNTIEISNYFAYHIKMTAFSDAELTELIMKKNNISGYKIIFNPAQRNLESSKFNKLDSVEKQEFLRNQFFNKLNDFSKGNISLALTYWLLSTNKITEESIEINYFESPDFSFINTLNSEKVFVLYILIMHDGLTLQHLSSVYKKPMDKLHLLIIMLLDDGILVERNGWYEVNPIIYRQSINMLKAKNLIY